MGRNHILIAAGIAAGIIAIAAFLLFRDDSTQPVAEQPTTVATQATTTTAAAADPPTTTTSTPVESTTTTAAAAESTTTTAAEEEPPAEDGTAEEPTTTSTPVETTSTTAAAAESTSTMAAEEEPPAEDGTAEEPTTTSTTGPLPEPGSVTSLAPVSSSGCGSYRGWAYMVKDQCLLDIAKVELTKYYAGTHAERMDAIRDGHILGSVFAELQTYIEAIYGEQANDLASPYSLYADADARHLRSVAVCCAEWRHQNLVSVRYQLRRVGILEGERAWSVAPFTRVDGQWKIDYTGFCRLVTNFGFGVGCPPDPRPGVVGASADELSIAAYGPVDDPNRESRRTYGW